MTEAVTRIRDYQETALDAIEAAWAGGARRVLCVSPTGSGKTVIGAECARRAVAADQRVLWLVHRRELCDQAVARMEAIGLAAGVILAGREPTPLAPVQVGTVQSVLARGYLEGDSPERADLCVLDEAHHFVGGAETWMDLALSAIALDGRAIGLTATPARSDGAPLGDLFERLVVAARYSELLAAGHIVPCRIRSPSRALDPGELAQDPAEAYVQYGEGRQAIVYARDLEHAGRVAADLMQRGILAACVTAETETAERAASLDAFRRGELRVLSNYLVLTEGLDVPDVGCIVLARSCAHASTYIQIAGRGLRPAADKTDMLLLDLSGTCHLHGPPTEDRAYSLDGEPIRRTAPVPLRTCLACGATFEATMRACPTCGRVEETKAPLRVTILGEELRLWSPELRDVFAGPATPDAAQQREYERLRMLARSRNWSVGWVVREFRRLFGRAPDLADVSLAEKAEEWHRLRDLGRSRGYKPGFAAVRYRSLFGEWPR